MINPVHCGSTVCGFRRDEDSRFGFSGRRGPCRCECPGCTASAPASEHAKMARLWRRLESMPLEAGDDTFLGRASWPDRRRPIPARHAYRSGDRFHPAFYEADISGYDYSVKPELARFLCDAEAFLAALISLPPPMFGHTHTWGEC